MYKVEGQIFKIQDHILDKPSFLYRHCWISWTHRTLQPEENSGDHQSLHLPFTRRKQAWSNGRRRGLCHHSLETHTNCFSKYYILYFVMIKRLSEQQQQKNTVNHIMRSQYKFKTQWYLTKLKFDGPRQTK